MFIILFVFKNFLRNESERLYNKSEGDSRRHRETGNRAYMASLYSECSVTIPTQSVRHNVINFFTSQTFCNYIFYGKY